MNRDSFVFYKDWIDAIQGLQDNVRLEVLEAIIEYGLTGEHKVLKSIAGVALNFIKPQIDRNNQRYKNGLQGAEYGKLGGRPRNPKETPRKPQRNP